ncbi:MAG: hypothetical protein D6679_04550 [Candidatus Hydrogenedentota bacterium]|nr:MAG: hypothetical protein D6679_04550 [Candidatus Hydrogenedentota bacterium]
MGDLKKQLASSRTRRRGRGKIGEKIEEILTRTHTARYIDVRIVTREDHSYRQERRGRPGSDTRYRRITKRRHDIEWSLNDEKIAYDRKSDGLYPLLTNDRTLSARQVLEAHKRQPSVEGRFRDLKSVNEIAPIFLKNEGRIEALFFLYFLALLVQGLIEREVRQSMRRKEIEELPIYPEERSGKSPTAEQILRLFGLIERHRLMKHGALVQTFVTELTELQKTVLKLLGVSESAYKDLEDM